MQNLLVLKLKYSALALVDFNQLFSQKLQTIIMFKIFKVTIQNYITYMKNLCEFSIKYTNPLKLLT